MLGHYPSPWGNELRFGLLESILACVFATVLLLAIMGGKKDIVEDYIEEGKSLLNVKFYVLFFIPIIIISVFIFWILSHYN